MKKQIWVYRNREYTIVKKFTYGSDHFAVCNDPDESWFNVIRIADLVKIQDSYQEKRKIEIDAEIAELQAKKKEKIEEMQDKAVKSLVFRLKMNTIMGDTDGKTSQVLLTIARELEKIIKHD